MQSYDIDHETSIIEDIHHWSNQWHKTQNSFCGYKVLSVFWRAEERTRTESTVEASRRKAVQYAKEEKEREAKQKNDKLEAQDKELHREEENWHSVLKTAESLVSWTSDKLKKSVIQKDIE